MTESNKIYCPKCNLRELEQPLEMNALSRKDNNTYICSPCGTREAMEELAQFENNKN